MSEIKLLALELTARAMHMSGDSLEKYLDRVRDSAIGDWEKEHGEILEYVGQELDASEGCDFVTGHLIFRVRERTSGQQE